MAESKQSEGAFFFFLAMLCVIGALISFLVFVVAAIGRSTHKDNKESEKYKTWNRVMKNSGYATLYFLVAAGCGAGAGAAGSV